MNMCVHDDFFHDERRHHHYLEIIDPRLVTNRQFISESCSVLTNVSICPSAQVAGPGDCHIKGGYIEATRLGQLSWQTLRFTKIWRKAWLRVRWVLLFIRFGPN